MKKMGKRVSVWMTITVIFLLVSLITAGICLYTISMMRNEYAMDNWQEHVIMTDYEDDMEFECT